MKAAAVIALLACAGAFAAQIDDSASLRLEPADLRKAWEVFEDLQRSNDQQKARIQELERQLEHVAAAKCA